MLSLMIRVCVHDQILQVLIYQIISVIINKTLTLRIVLIIDYIPTCTSTTDRLDTDQMDEGNW